MARMQATQACFLWGAHGAAPLQAAQLGWEPDEGVTGQVAPVFVSLLPWVAPCSAHSALMQGFCLSGHLVGGLHHGGDDHWKDAVQG